MRRRVYLLLGVFTLAVALSQTPISSGQCVNGVCQENPLVTHATGIINLPVASDRVMIWNGAQTKKHPAICEVWIGRATYPASGSLVDVGQDYGLVLTAAHLFDRPDQGISIRFPDGQRFIGKLNASNQAADIAVVQISVPSNIKPIAVAVDYVKAGDPVWFAGYGTGGYRQFKGHVVGYRKAKGQTSYHTLVINPRARPGDSGAPIFNVNDELVAVLSARNDARNETIGTYCGRINVIGYEWCGNQLLPWNARNEASEIEADAAREQALIALIQKNQQGTDPALLQRIGSLEIKVDMIIKQAEKFLAGVPQQELPVPVVVPVIPPISVPVTPPVMVMPPVVPPTAHVEPKVPEVQPNSKLIDLAWSAASNALWFVPGIGVLVWFLRRTGIGGAAAGAGARGIDQITDWIPGKWDDKLLDGIAYKAAKYMGWKGEIPPNAPPAPVTPPASK